MIELTAAKYPPQPVDVGGNALAYRTFGPDSGVPLLLCQRFRGTMDHWDPLLISVLAGQRRVVAFDNVGVGRSSGVAPARIADMAADALALVGRLGFEQVDLLGWSMGGCVAQRMALQAPEVVRRLVLAGTSPGGVADAPAAPAKVWEVAGKPVNDDEDFLYLFFHDSDASIDAGRAHLQRLTAWSAADAAPVAPASVGAQVQAISAWGSGADGVLAELGRIGQPTLVANGVHDRMVHAYNSYVLAQELPDADLVLYADAGHGFAFQHPERFGSHVVDFLTQPR
jgi:pimeloyl-ACP methyl ester carboxylesterase